MNFSSAMPNNYLVDRGAGPACLFLHANLASAAQWAGVIAELTPQYRCIAPDLPGFGASTGHENVDCRLEGLAEHVNMLMDAAALDTPVNLVVHGIGGLYGLAWAIRYPQRVGRIAILNTRFFSDGNWHRWGRLAAMPMVGELARRLVSRQRFAAEIERASWGLDEPTIARLYQGCNAQAWRMAGRLYRANPAPAFAAWEPRLLELTRSKPSLVVWGDRDRYTRADDAQRFGAARIVHVAECGHWLPLEAPRRLAGVLSEFFRQPLVGAP